MVLAFKHQNSDWNPGLSWLENAKRFPTGREDVSRTPTMASLSSGRLQHECLVPVLPLPPPPQVRWLRNRDWDWYPNCTGIPHPHPHALTPAAWGLLWRAAAEEGPPQTQKTTCVTAAEAQKWVGRKGGNKGTSAKRADKGGGAAGNQALLPTSTEASASKSHLNEDKENARKQGGGTGLPSSLPHSSGQADFSRRKAPRLPWSEGCWPALELFRYEACPAACLGAAKHRKPRGDAARQWIAGIPWVRA